MVQPSDSGRVVGFAHAGLAVADLQRALAFYRDLLGLEVEAEYQIDAPYIFAVTACEGSAVQIAYLRVPGSEVRLELLEYQGATARPVAAQPSDPGCGHLALRVADLDEFHRRLIHAGYRARSQGPVVITQGPRAGNRALYAIDPDGYFVEIVEVKRG